MLNLKKIALSGMILFGVSLSAYAADMNCTLRQNSNFVTDAYGMYNNTSTKAKCLDKCKDYAKRSVNSLANSDVITKLSWTCSYNKKDIHTKKLK